MILNACTQECRRHKGRSGRSGRSRAVFIALAAVALLCPGDGFAVKKEKVAEISGAPRLWRDPGNIARKDLYWGIGSREGMPEPPFQFVKESFKGANPKVDVTDAHGVKWSVKFESLQKNRNEVHAEPVATRIVWALGFTVEEEYFIPSGTIRGVTELKRARHSLGHDGSFKNARFKRQPREGKKWDVYWHWNHNPFAGTRELSGLKILMALLGNWDTKTVNNAVLEQRGADGKVEDWYMVSDLGTAFGKMGTWPWKRTMWILEDYRTDRGRTRVKNGVLSLHYRGRSKIGKVPLEHARWFARLLAQLSQDQIKRALEAGGGSPAETAGFSAELKSRIDQFLDAARKEEATAARSPQSLAPAASAVF